MPKIRIYSGTQEQVKQAKKNLIDAQAGLIQRSIDDPTVKPLLRSLGYALTHLDEFLEDTVVA